MLCHKILGAMTNDFIDLYGPEKASQKWLEASLGFLLGCFCKTFWDLQRLMERDVGPVQTKIEKATKEGL